MIIKKESKDNLNENPDLAEERNKATFDPFKLGNFFWQGQLLRRKEILSYVEAQGAELCPRVPEVFMSRMEQMEDVARLSVAMANHAEKVIDVFKPEEQFYFNSLICGFNGSPFHLHLIMAVPAMINSCDDDQATEWLPKLLNRELIATYAQTEMGHGTNLRALETTATYDPSTEQFILNTPTITATKWWPGALGKSVNYAVVIAQLWTNGKCYGPHPFWVQLRDLETHKSLPGITLGDIGPKLGTPSNDNGFLRFENYRIPRRHMLMKHAKVLPSGEYVPPLHAKVGYTSMMYVRSMMIYGHAIYLAQAATIAIRYSCIRRQGEIKPGAGEVKVLDYKTQQYRLLPVLAHVYAIAFTGLYINQLYHTVIGDINAGDVSLLADLHSLGSGLKALTSWQITRGVEQCRLACGGHGYSDASGLPSIYTMVAGSLTYEGENIVMLLQTARSLMKVAAECSCVTDNIEKIKENEGKMKNPITGYIFRKPTGSSLINENSNVLDYLAAFEHNSRRLILSAFEYIQQQKKLGRSAEEAWNEAGIHLCHASKAHTQTFMARIFSETIPKIEDIAVRHVMEDILWLYLTYELVHSSVGLLEEGFLSSHQMSIIRKKLFTCLDRIRPNSVALVDSFDFTDRELRSVLGRKDGQVYENLLEWAKKSPLNEHDVLPFHEKYLGSAMREARKKREEMSKL
uniref:Acyl-coenzyme A oxidase n=1 Tax=Meloidogyne incognita TaxID=6306 RepID=A0A914MNE9_MELIC